MEEQNNENLNVINEAVQKFEMEQKEAELTKPRMAGKAYSSRMVGWVIKGSGGLVKNEEQANYVLLVLAIIIFVIAGIVFFTR